MAQVILEITADATGLTPATKEVNNLNKSFDTLENTIVDADGKVIKLSKSVAANNPEVVKLSKGFNDLNKTLSSGAMKQGAKDLADLGKATVDTDKKTLSLKAQILELRKAAGQAAISMGELEAAGKAGSAEYQKLNKVYTDSIQKAARLKETQDDLSESVNRLANNKLEIALNGMVAAARLSAAGFGVAASTAALFGDESEELQRTMVKLQAVMTLVNSLQEIQQLLRKEDALNTARQTFLTGGLATAKSAEATATVANTAATQANTVAKNAALLSTTALSTLGIGALIIGIVALTNYLADSGDEADDYSFGLNEIAGSAENAAEQIGEYLGPALDEANYKMSLKYQEALLQYGEDIANMGLNAYKTAQALDRAAAAAAWWDKNAESLNKRLNEQLDVMRLLGESQKGGINDIERLIKLRQEQGVDELDIIDLQILANEKRVEFLDKEISLNERYANKMTIGGEARIKQENHIIELKQQRLDIENDIEIAEIKIANIKIERNKKLIENQEEQLKLTREADNKDIQERLRIIGEFYDLKLVGIEKGTQAELEILRQRYKAENDLINKNYVELGLTELQAQLRIAQNNQVIIDLEEGLGKKRAEIRKKYFDANIAQIEAAKQAEIDAAQKVIDANNQKAEYLIQTANVVSSTVFEIVSMYQQKEFDQSIADINKKKDAELASENLTEAQKTAIQIKYENQMAALRKRQFIQEKNAKIADATTNGLLALTRLLIQPGVASPQFPFALALTLATTASSVAKIAATPIPAFAKGTKKAPAGFKWVGEQGPELINTPGNHAIITAPESAHIADIFEKYNLPGLKVPKFNTEAITTTATSAPNLDYDKIGKSIAKHLPEATKVNISLDENGFTKVVAKSNSRQSYNNNKFRYH